MAKQNYQLSITSIYEQGKFVELKKKTINIHKKKYVQCWSKILIQQVCCMIELMLFTVQYIWTLTNILVFLVPKVTCSNSENNGPETFSLRCSTAMLLEKCKHLILHLNQFFSAIFNSYVTRNVNIPFFIWINFSTV